MYHTGPLPLTFKGPKQGFRLKNCQNASKLLGKTLYSVIFIVHLFFSTPLHCSIFCKNKAVFEVLLQHGKPNLELKNADGYTVLWLALQEVSYSSFLNCPFEDLSDFFFFS